MENTTQRIADKIAEIFPEETIYTENQKNGFDVPSFYIAKNLTNIKSRFFKIQDRTVSYQVIYFANPEAPNADMDRVEGLLLDNFTQLDDYTKIRNREFKVDQKEETLIINFDLFLNMYWIDRTPKQRKLHIHGGYKEKDHD